MLTRAPNAQLFPSSLTSAPSPTFRPSWPLPLPLASSWKGGSPEDFQAINRDYPEDHQLAIPPPLCPLPVTWRNPKPLSLGSWDSSSTGSRFKEDRPIQKAQTRLWPPISCAAIVPVPSGVGWAPLSIVPRPCLLSVPAAPFRTRQTSAHGLSDLSASKLARGDEGQVYPLTGPWGDWVLERHAGRAPWRTRAVP